MVYRKQITNYVKVRSYKEFKEWTMSHDEKKRIEQHTDKNLALD